MGIWLQVPKEIIIYLWEALVKVRQLHSAEKCGLDHLSGI